MEQSKDYQNHIASSILALVSNVNTQKYAILDFDEQFLCKQSLAKMIQADQEEMQDNISRAQTVILSLVNIFLNQDEEQIKKHASENTLSMQFIAGICLHDLLHSQEWVAKVFLQNKSILEDICQKLADVELEDYGARNLSARIFSRILFMMYKDHQQPMLEIIENLCEETEMNKIEVVLRTLIYLLEKIEDEGRIKEFHIYVPTILSSILGTFTHEEIGNHGRDQILHIFYLCLRTISWADGIDNELIGTCLDDTFNQWMAVFLQIIQSDANKFFDIKRNALKCLTVIFRDFINYSRECINMILRPAWKLMNSHLPIFTEMLGYNKKIEDVVTILKTLKDEGQSDESEDDNADDALQRGYESEEDDKPEEPFGIKGMTLQLIELLTTLVQRPNVQEVVKESLYPLLKTVSSYMIIEFKDSPTYKSDEHYFLHDKTNTSFKKRNIKNQCVDLFSSLIEIFGDLAIKAILNIIKNLLGVDDENANQDQDPEQMASQALDEKVYMSAHKNHPWKRKDIAMILFGLFIEDVQMYVLRNPELDLTDMIKQIVEIDFKASGNMRSYLVGRALWCASTCSEALITSDEKTIMLKIFILDLSIESLKSEDHKSIKLVSTRTLVRYARKMKKENLQENAQKFESILDDLLKLLDVSGKEVMYLPIEAFYTFSNVNQETVSQMAPKITPKLLEIFKTEHSESSLGQELINLFKIWCQYDACRDIFINTFIPFIMEIIESYYKSTPNEENKDSMLQMCSVSESLSLDSSNEKQRPSLGDQKVLSVVDSTILQHVLDLLCTLLKKTDQEKHPQEFQKITACFPQLLNFVHKSDDMFLLLHGTTALKNFIFVGHAEILKIVDAAKIIEVSKKLLSPLTNEQAAMCLGNLIIQIFHKIQPDIDTSVLFCVVQKIYKSRMPSTLQSLVLVFARLIHTNPNEIVELLSETSVDNRISLKVVLDKWLLQQPLFRGQYTRTVTLSALQKLFMMRDSRIESLMVIGYNPSHSNINSEVNAPFKILSTLLRFVDTETKGELSGKKGPEEEKDSEPAFAGYQMKRNFQGGERLDTMEGYNDLYGDEEEPSENDDDNQNDFDNMKDESSSEEDQGENADGDSPDKKKKSKKNKNKNNLDTSQEKIEVNLDDIEDDEDQECLLDYKQNEYNKNKKIVSKIDKGLLINQNNSADNSNQELDPNLFKIKESQDKGLADMETGSEVYMSELLAGFDMEDFDEVDEQNEEDLMLLGDSFAKVSGFKNHIISEFQQFMSNTDQGQKYVDYCIKQLLEEDQILAHQYLNSTNN